MPSREPGLGEVFVILADSLTDEYDIVGTMDALVQACTSFTSAIEAGIVLADENGRLHVIASTSERSTQVEEEQIGVDEGPCWVAYRGGEVVEIDDITKTADRWPRFAAAAGKRGFRAAHAVPLRLRENLLGSLNLFSDQPEPLSMADAALVQALADVAAIGIIQQRTIREGVDLGAQLQHALESRILIEQAKGILAERHQVSVTDAFHALRSYARNGGRRLDEVARRVTANELDIPVNGSLTPR